jgi:hypothetical protein
LLRRAVVAAVRFKAKRAEVWQEWLHQSSDAEKTQYYNTYDQKQYLRQAAKAKAEADAAKKKAQAMKTQCKRQ